MTMLNVFDLDRRKRAVLQNAYNIVEEHEINQIYSLHFSFPADDEKAQYILPRHYVRWGDDHELYRIKKPSNSESNIDVNTYECEHVITTLCDNVMFGSHNVGGSGMHTADVIQWILSKQSTQNWVLDECDFDRQFEYLWEQENLLNALYSIPKEFAKPYMWTFNTTVYPWRISLKEINPNSKPGYYLRAKSNILSSGTSADYSNICTRIYPLGYGEGVNQLNIADVNDGIPYLQSPQSIVAQYGIVEKVLVDRRFENAESLKAYAQTMLEAYQEPTMSRSFSVTDLYPLTNQDWDDAEVGKICRMTKDNTTAYITKTRRQYDKAGDLQIDISTKANDIASNIADLADRVRIESVYAQGATQLYQHSKDANATPTKGMIMSLYFPSEMRQINKVLMRLKLNRFRSYSQATDGGGASTITSQSGGSSTITSQAGGNSTVTSESGGASTVTSEGGGGTGTTSTADSGGNIQLSTYNSTNETWVDPSAVYVSRTYLNNYDYGTRLELAYNSGAHSHSSNGCDATEFSRPPEDDLNHNHVIHSKSTSYDGEHYHTITDKTGHIHGFDKSTFAHWHAIRITNNYGKSGLSHSHNFSIGSHTHSVSIPAHTHSVSVPSHTHSVSIPAHTHNVSIPSHTHTISAGIFESGNPSEFDIYVGGVKKTTVSSTNFNDDITAWLLNDRNQIPRGSWIDVEIRPNDLAYVVCSVFVQGFVQSRGGGNY